MERKVSPWQSPWVIAWVGLIIVFVAANGVMIFLAIQTSPGLVVEDYYDRGQDYERSMLTRMSRDAGWHARLDVPSDVAAGRTSPVRFSVVDRAGTPIEAESVTLYAYRPSDARYDFDLPMEAEGAGLYRADVRFPLIGVWDVLASVKRGDEEFNVGQRIAVARP